MIQTGRYLIEQGTAEHVYWILEELGYERMESVFSADSSAEYLAKRVFVCLQPEAGIDRIYVAPRLCQDGIKLFAFLGCRLHPDRIKQMV